MNRASTAAVVLSAIALTACGGGSASQPNATGGAEDVAVASAAPSPSPSPSEEDDHHALNAQALAMPKPPMPAIKPRIDAANQAEGATVAAAALAALDGFRRDASLLTSETKTTVDFSKVKGHMSSALYNNWALPRINTFLTSYKNGRDGETGDTVEDAYYDLAGLLTLVFNGDSHEDGKQDGSETAETAETAAGYDVTTGAHGPMTIGSMLVNDLVVDGRKGYMVVMDDVVHELNVLGEAAKKEKFRFTAGSLSYEMFQEDGKWVVDAWQTDKNGVDVEVLPR